MALLGGQPRPAGGAASQGDPGRPCRRWLQLCTRWASGGQLVRPAERREPGAWAAVARLRPARTARPQLRVQLSRVVFVQLRSSIAARPPRRGPGWEALPSLSAPGSQRLGTATAAPARARETW